MAHQAQYESDRATVADDPYDHHTGAPAFAESFWIGLPKQPPESGIIGKGSFLRVEDARTEIFDRIA